MVDIEQLANDVLEFSKTRAKDNYTINIIIVGPPGSGKSTIAEKLSANLNKKFKEFIQNKVIASIGLDTNVDINRSNELIEGYYTSGIPDISDELRKTLNNKGFDEKLVENVNFKPVKECIIANNKQQGYKIIGRGGMDNSIEIQPHKIQDIELNDINISQIIPMDGFHLSRKCLDEFKDPNNAHQRRGAPSTFDSNNFLQLCKLLCKTSKIKPIITESSTQESTNLDNPFSAFLNSFNQNIPNILVPGFNHAEKDPKTNVYDISCFTRIMIVEGLYLLYNQENWLHIYKSLLETNSVLFFNIDLDDEILEDRVAKRHLNSGIVDNLEDGIKRFRSNDVINAGLLRKYNVHDDNIIQLNND
ncbi:hypothetical protein TBLA_0C00480 [Henningerozyma blattae CBS 6284]|uniref:Uncharacterized protein n=1 Tax=Henningerozyma blattae (strain ATCC 34711 / CBS 6284 / DSM 70876 / NBRC 10599 / NRRL Y-10934 / UCD 77-7) TaxID=1071380 RepID=I2H0G2_HENB6|nr:hypothetical protein TBLA_0C00480 [Tetrapisispora blattae CBS 6284]CCH59864.1 hypothetical protein TBLA_0C00480 [Tetrapisispora blattae CBS 6284]